MKESVFEGKKKAGIYFKRRERENSGRKGFLSCPSHLYLLVHAHQLPKRWSSEGPESTCCPAGALAPTAQPGLPGLRQVPVPNCGTGIRKRRR